MNGFVFDLPLRGGHEIADSDFGIFGPVRLDVADFEVEELFVEAAEEGEEEELLPLEPEVAVCEVKGPGPGRRLREHEEVLGAGDESEGCESSHEEKGLSTSEAEMLIVGGYLFRTAKG